MAAVCRSVCGDVLGLQRRAVAAGGGEVPGEAFLDGVAAEPSAGPVREQGLLRFAVPFGQPGAQDGDGVLRERSNAFLASLAVAGDVRPGANVDIAAGQ
jgi:hypothetical protein